MFSCVCYSCYVYTNYDNYDIYTLIYCHSTVAHKCHTQTKRQYTQTKATAREQKLQHADKSHGTKEKATAKKKKPRPKRKSNGTKEKATAQKKTHSTKKIGTHSVHVGILSEVTTDILYDFDPNQGCQTACIN